MNLSFYIAKRYLFSKKKQNAINIISIVAVCGVAVATLAAVCTLSVFNGFQSLVSDMFSSFDPELKITPVKGKVFNPNDSLLLEIYSLPEIETISETLEDNAIVKYNERQVPVVMKGVQNNFQEIANTKSIMFDGEYILENEENNFAVLGFGVAVNLGVNANFIHPLDVYIPKRNTKINLVNPMTSINIGHPYIGGIFLINQTSYDDYYMLVSIDFAREMLNYENEVSALEVKLKEGYNANTIKKQIKNILGDSYYVKDRYEQQESVFKMMNIEKWVSFLMLCFIVLIAAFNIIGSLSMLMVNKQNDIITLRNLGANNTLISRIFLFEGWLISLVGAVTGVILGVLLCLGQSHFGWIKLGNVQGAFAVNSYPVVVEFLDVMFIFIAVISIGFLIVLYPVKYFSNKTK
ncbi:lipoprotein-releasing system permease protein [Dysgonomonadaceae bacterium PH5-43]|nr:lipoprotein-releasing system permease protein [Dysgonomonadaceae bacterium PH5-43]